MQRYGTSAQVYPRTYYTTYIRICTWHFHKNARLQSLHYTTLKYNIDTFIIIIMHCGILASTVAYCKQQLPFQHSHNSPAVRLAEVGEGLSLSSQQ